MMYILEDLRLGWMGLRGNKLRSALTILGIIIGVAAVIALISVGQNASSQVTERVAGLGSNLLIISPNRGTRAQLSLADLEVLREKVQGLVALTPVVSGTVTTRWGGQVYDTSLQGVGTEYLQVQNRQLAAGNSFSTDEAAARARVAVLGATVVEELYGHQNPLNTELLINGDYYQVIGILDTKGSSTGQDQDDIVIIPVTSAQRLLRTTAVQQIYTQAASGADAALLVDHITRVLNAHLEQDDAVSVFSQDELLEVMDEMSVTLALMLGSIAGISLLVGGIGVMNIMLVSVTERTREIGVRKALGARYRDIRNQFLVEAVSLSIIGGVLGIVIGIGASHIISRYAGWKTGVSFSAVALSFGFAAAVGIIFGLWPAIRAARLNPVDALRYE